MSDHREVRRDHCQRRTSLSSCAWSVARPGSGATGWPECWQRSRRPAANSHHIRPSCSCAPAVAARTLYRRPRLGPCACGSRREPEAPRTAEGCRGRAREQCALRATAVHPSGHARLWERAFDLGAGRPGPARWQRSEGRCRTPPGLRLPSAGRRGARPLSGWGSGANQGQPRTLSRGSTVQVSVPAPPRTLSSPTLSWAFKESFPSPAMRWSAPVPLTRVSSPMLP
jgi:hypothetical protein